MLYREEDGSFPLLVWLGSLPEKAQLAKLAGSSRSAISRLEDDAYEGHSLAMLQRIAAAPDKRVEIRFVTIGRKLRTA